MIKLTVALSSIMLFQYSNNAALCDNRFKNSIVVEWVNVKFSTLYLTVFVKTSVI